MGCGGTQTYKTEYQQMLVKLNQIIVPSFGGRH
jgi:hypothetical protein